MGKKERKEDTTSSILHGYHNSVLLEFLDAEE
jgi:hypothetical protein